jgi:death-on-curing protein
MKAPRWINKHALLLLHGVSLARFGGADGIRDEGLIDASLARAQNQLRYGHAKDLADLAAAYAFGFAKNHPFVDGNKRMAFLSCGLFLEINNKHLAAEPADAISAVVALADGTISEPQFAAWIRKNLRQV